MKDLTTVKQGKATTVQDRSGKCLTEERQILNRWTEYCSELCNHKTNGDPSVLKCPQTHTEDDHPILRKEVEAAVQLLKEGKSAGVDNIQAEMVQAGEEDVTDICRAGKEGVFISLRTALLKLFLRRFSHVDFFFPSGMSSDLSVTASMVVRISTRNVTVREVVDFLVYSYSRNRNSRVKLTNLKEFVLRRYNMQ